MAYPRMTAMGRCSHFILREWETTEGVKEEGT